MKKLMMMAFRKNSFSRRSHVSRNPLSSERCVRHHASAYVSIRDSIRRWHVSRNPLSSERYVRQHASAYADGT